MNNLKKTFMLLSMVILLTSIFLPISFVKAEDQPLFKVTIIAPGNANMVRRQWGQVFANSLRQLGIDARVVFLGWASCYDRSLTPPPERVGKTWDQGGYDIQLIGWTPGLLPEPRQLFYGGDPAFFAPDGQNYYLWNNTQSNLLLDQFITATSTAAQEQALKAWQTLYMNEMPSSQIVYQAAPAVVSPRIANLGNTSAGEGWLYFNAQPNPEYLKTTSGSENVTFASTGEIQSLIPPLSNSWYDTIIISCIYSGLVSVAPDLSDLTVPSLLTSWNSTADGFNWQYDLRQNVKWHDGWNFTADDILYSLWALMNSATGSQFVGYYQSVYGNRIKFTWENGTSTWLNSTSTPERLGNIWADGAYKVKFTLPVLALGKPFGYFDPYMLGFSSNFIPKHIFEKIAPADWTDSCFNTGQGSNTITLANGTTVTYYGPVGTGPYMWKGFAPVTQAVTLEKFSGYWNASALEADGMFGVKKYTIKFIADKTAALAALKNGEVDMLDANYQMQVDVPTIDPSWGKVLDQQGTGRQEIGYNMRHPIFGTGVDTPLGKANTSRAAEAARYVRLAFDYAVPRQLIIDNLLSGYGELGATPMLPSQPFYDASITAREYNLTKAREYLVMAGYTAPGPLPPPTLPSFILGFSYPVSGVFTDAEGLPISDTEVWLMATENNATGVLDALKVGQTTTDSNGEYFLSIAPTTTGVFYYYLLNPFGVPAPTDDDPFASSKYLTMLNVSTLQDAFTPYYDLLVGLQNQTNTLQNQVNNMQNSLNTMTYIAVAALIVAILLGAIVIVLPRMSKKH
jgi:ABC-type transport system substrate-binding protein